MSTCAPDRVTCVRGDITLETTDAIVNAANGALRGGGGVDGAIHRAAGPGLLEACARLHPEGCPTGEVRVTEGFDLPARFVIHAVGPVWRGGAQGEEAQLAACTARAIEACARLELSSVAFPAISCGVYGYPWRAAATVSLRALSEALSAHPSVERVRMVLFSAELLEVFASVENELRAGA
jgi:O-acetyl-ADP-ribose deacetylase (regulator of RNase III)